MREKPRILKTETLARTGIFHIQQVDLRFSNGVETRYERLMGSKQGAVLVVPLTAEGEVLMIREYAAGVERYELGLPKGRIERDEDMLVAANREIMEEVGYGARRLERISSLSLAPGYLSHTTHVILARDLYPRRLEGDEPEAIEVVPWPLNALAELLTQPDLTEARSIAALFLTREALADER